MHPDDDPQSDPVEAGTLSPADSEPASRSLGPLRMLFSAAARYPAQVTIAGIALIVTASATLAIPAGFRLIIDRGFSSGGNPEDIGRWFQYLLMIVAVLALGTAVRFYMVSWLGERVVADIRLAVNRNLMRLSPSFFEINSPKEISSRMTADTAIVEQIVGTTVSVAMRNAIMAIVGTVYLFTLAPTLMLGMIIGIPAVILPIYLFGVRLQAVSRASQDRIADIGAITTEVLGAVGVVQAFNQEEREEDRFAGVVERTFETAKRRFTIRAVMTAVVIFLIFGAITLLMWRGALDVASGTISGGTIAAFVITGGLVAGSFGALTEVYGDLVRGAGAASRLSELLAERPVIAAPSRPTALPEPPRGQIAFENVTFRYPARPEVAALSQFTLKVEPGETVAIVGPSGAGKSTLFQLAERFYDPQAGTIKLDGVPLASADPAEVRRRMALVPQEGVLFAANARDNLRYG
ncbi:MAG: ATP-binding cassette domain-containing protein, partial [Novosphingobium sp.]|nr:ATP-binding cassette domain-containing protein [Novosphingobium sp.]